MIYIDANVLYNYIFETDLTKHAIEVLNMPVPKMTSDTAINEAIFTTLRKLAKEEYGITSTRALKTALKSGKIDPAIIPRAYSYVKATMISKNVITVPENVAWDEVIVLAERYRLLPSDARILATAIANGAGGLATLDRDFERATELIKLYPKSFWE
ncbi:PIN domain-containing protein [Thermococcus sp.]|uniref:PIN domain-containing protein n=1 Tax=Thermococcus sp. TaxID=35749 RepID=UPI0025E64EF3|nr:PIN domain-containing protein [Thermococcus sp.]